MGQISIRTFPSRHRPGRRQLRQHPFPVQLEFLRVFPRMTASRANSPCLSAFREPFAFPSAVRGPVDFCTSNRRVWICAMVAMMSPPNL
jgi:hypothetical protein